MRRKLSTSGSWFESRPRWARFSTERCHRGLFTILHIISVSTYVVRVHIFLLLRWNRKWKDWDRLKHPWRKELKGSELRFKFFCFSSTQSMLIQVRAAWEDLEARREEFLKEKKVLAHLGFYWASVEIAFSTCNKDVKKSFGRFLGFCRIFQPLLLVVDLGASQVRLSGGPSPWRWWWWKEGVVDDGLGQIPWSCICRRLILSVVGSGEGEDKDYPDLPKNWGFMTLRRTKKK